MQQNADLVEKDILRSEELLAVVRVLHKRTREDKPSLSLAALSKRFPFICRLPPPGCRKWQEGAALRASGRDLRQTGRGGGAAEGTLLGRGQSQEVQTPASQRHRERVSCDWMNITQRSYCVAAPRRDVSLEDCTEDKKPQTCSSIEEMT